jgi:Fungal Zn(2)-Cys(6) binuclear cluster domain/C2H2-type zinc finger
MAQHVCKTCSRVFQRGEHLRRHMKRHTLEREYICPLCCYSFGRRDVLMRHVLLHARSGSGREMRTVAACDACARAKTKCDKGVPCGPCRKAGLSCSFRRKRGRMGLPRQDMTETQTNASTETSNGTGAEILPYAHDGDQDRTICETLIYSGETSVPNYEDRANELSFDVTCSQLGSSQKHVSSKV